MRLKSVYISEFKNLKNFTVKFDGTSFIDIFVGKNGTGKSNFFEALICIFRHLFEYGDEDAELYFDYTLVFDIDNSETTIEFKNSAFKVNGKDRYTINDSIRTVLTEPRLNLNEKFGAKGDDNVYTRIFLASNHVNNALQIPKEDRRIWAVDGANNFKGEEYFVELYDWLDSEGVAQLFWYLNRVSIRSEFAALRAPLTPARDRLVSCGESNVDYAFELIQEKLPEGVDVVEHSVLSTCMKSLIVEMDPKAAGIHRDKSTDKSIDAVIADRAPLLLGEKRIKVEGQQKFARVVRNEKNWRGSTDQEKKEVRKRARNSMAIADVYLVTASRSGEDNNDMSRKLQDIQTKAKLEIEKEVIEGKLKAIHQEADVVKA